MADPDNLEYHIKFPSSNFDYGQQNGGDSDFVFVVDEKRIPVVLLFGWAGCQDRYLAKYSQIYEDKGLITLRYTAPVKCLFWKRYQMESIGKNIVKLLLDMNFETHPVIVHCFSNGGAFLYQNFSFAIEKSQTPIQVNGVIFDSAPGKRRVVTLYRAISAILGGGYFYNFSVSLLMTAFLSIMWFYEAVRSYITSTPMQTGPLDALKNEKNKWPQHFIYSKADDLIPSKDVDYFADYRNSFGVDVTRLCFDASPHVKHFSWHRDDYVSSVYAFLNKCLNGVGTDTNQ